MTIQWITEWNNDSFTICADVLSIVPQSKMREFLTELKQHGVGQEVLQFTIPEGFDWAGMTFQQGLDDIDANEGGVYDDQSYAACLLMAPSGRAISGLVDEPYAALADNDRLSDFYSLGSVGERSKPSSFSNIAE